MLFEVLCWFSELGCYERQAVFIVEQEVASRFLVKVRGYKCHCCDAVCGVSWQAHV